MVKLLLRHFIREAQKQYLNHLRAKMHESSFEQESSQDNKMYAFKHQLLSKALTPVRSLYRPIMHGSESRLEELTKPLDLNVLKEAMAS